MLVPPPCPPGATELALDLCPQQAPDPSAELLASVGDAVRGDVVLDLPELGSSVCMPVRTCEPDAAPTLIFSDEPEYVATDGVLYADELETGRYRVYLYHVNDGNSLRRFSVVALNQTAVPATVTVEKLAYALPSPNFLGVGRSVALDYLTAGGKPAVTVPAMTRVVVDDEIDGLVADPGELVHSIFQILVVGEVKLSVVSVGQNADAAAVTAGLPLLPNTNTHTRGTFPKADRILLSRHPGGLRRLRLGGDEAIDPHLVGTNYVDGGAVTLPGNFGVLYDVRVSDPTTQLFVGVNPRAGAWAGAVAGSAGLDANGGEFLAPDTTASVADNTSVVSLGRYTSGIDVGARFLTAGGSNLPIHLVVTESP
jgi:hypothetical protein